MEKIGILYGVYLLADTDDEEKLEKINKFLDERMTFKPKTDKELDEEVSRILN